MKRLLLFTVLAFVLVSGSQVTAEKKGSKTKKCSEDKVEAKCNHTEGTKGHGQWSRKGHGAGFDKFKKHHKDLISQLKNIRDIAVNENATQTVKAIDELVDKMQKRFHEKAELLKKKMHEKGGWGKATKSKSSPPDCTKSCCAAKKNTGTCPKLKKAKTCPKTEQ